MVRGNEHLHQLLEYIHHDVVGAELAEFASTFSLSEEAMASEIGATLRRLASAGIPLQTWGKHWSGIAQDQDVAEH